MTDTYASQVGGDHYKKMTIQPAIFINQNNIQYAEGCVIKYVCRHQAKGGREDIEKAIHYLSMILDRDYSNVPVFSSDFNFIHRVTEDLGENDEPEESMKKTLF